MSLILKEHTDHLEKGQGASFDIVGMSSYLGEIEISICSICDFMRIQCCHENNTWLGIGKDQSLICELCGLDVT